MTKPPQLRLNQRVKLRMPRKSQKSFIHSFYRHSRVPISSEIEVAKGNLLQVRTYDVMITYDKYYQTPRIWLLGYDEVSSDIPPSFRRPR